MTKLDHVCALWHTLDQLTQQIRPAATGHIRTTISVLLNYLRDLENDLDPGDLVMLELLRPDRWQNNWMQSSDF